MNDRQKTMFEHLTWMPQTGPTGWSMDTVVNVHGCRIILYPSGKLDVLSVADSPMAREYEAALRENYSDRILGHVATFRVVGGSVSRDS